MLFLAGLFAVVPAAVSNVTVDPGEVGWRELSWALCESAGVALGVLSVAPVGLIL